MAIYVMVAILTIGVPVVADFAFNVGVAWAKRKGDGASAYLKEKSYIKYICVGLWGASLLLYAFNDSVIESLLGLFLIGILFLTPAITFICGVICGWLSNLH